MAILKDKPCCPICRHDKEVNSCTEFYIAGNEEQTSFVTLSYWCNKCKCFFTIQFHTDRI